MLRIISILALIVLSGCSLSIDNLYKLGYTSTVRVLTKEDKAHGSGFIAEAKSGNLVIITNEHVCYGSESFRILFPVLAKTSMSLSPYKANIDIDLCAFLLPMDLQPLLTPYNIAFSQDLHSEIHVIGYPVEKPMVVSTGFSLEYAVLHIADPRPERCTNPLVTIFGSYCLKEQLLIQTSAVTFPGNSGSPVVNNQGEIVGVLNSGDNETNYGNMIPLVYLKQFLSEL